MIEVIKSILWDISRVHDTIGSGITYVHIRNRDRTWKDAKYLFENRGDRQDSLLAAGQHLHTRTSRVSHAARYEFAREHFDSNAGEWILDVASGLGYGSDIMLDASFSRYVGIDIDKIALDYARQNYEGESREYLLGDGPQLPLLDDSIHYVTSFETMEHIRKDTYFLAELNRVTTNSASILISVPYNESKETIRGDWNRSKDYPHINTYTFNSFRDKLCGAFDEYTINIYEQKVPSSVLSSNPPSAIRQTASYHLSDLFEKRQSQENISNDSPAMVAHIHP